MFSHAPRKGDFAMSENLEVVPTEPAAALATEVALVPPELSPAVIKNSSDVNTPESLGVTPRYVLQYNAISRSIQNLSPVAKKLTAMAMALIPPDLSSLTVAFTFSDFCKALDMPTGGEQYKIFKDAVDECMQCVISIEIPADKKGKKKWEKFTWFIYAKYNEATGKANMTFSPILAAALLDLKRVYAKIDLKDMGQLQSKYALRYFELAKSYSYLQGKEGNPDDMWYFVCAVEELRRMLSVPEGSYPATGDFRKKVVEYPLRELNEAGIGLEITTESIKQGRKVTGIQFNCKKVAKQVRVKGKGRKKADAASLELPEQNPKIAGQRKEKETQHLKELYPDEFAELYAAELAKSPKFLQSSALGKVTAEGEALVQLRERHGIVK
jgi:plasmid replication initiation protein